MVPPASGPSVPATPLPTVAVPRCPVCGTDGGAVVHDGLTDRAFGVAPGSWRLRGCAGCGALRLDPRPADAAIGGLYRAYYTHEAPRTELPAGVLRALRNAHLNARMGYRLAPAARAGALGGRLVPPLAAIAQRGVRGVPLGRRLLDVGCGNGAFVAEARASGWEASGIDLDPLAVEAGQRAGLDLAVEAVEDRAAREPGAFDALTLEHVLEHVANPVAFLRSCRELLRPGGRLWVATPNPRSLGHRRFGADWLHLDPPRHLVLLDHDAATAALHAAGLRDVTVQRPTPTAGPIFRISAAIAAGVVPANPNPQSGRALGVAGALADLRAQADPRLGEEVLLVAVR